MLRGSKLIVLIVDDESQNRKLLKLFCERWHFAVIEASDGREAIEKAKYEKPDIILMDALMPKMDGFTATRLLKKDPITRHIPVLIVTALDEREEKDKSIDVGADDFISKPINMHELKSRLQNALLKRDSN